MDDIIALYEKYRVLPDDNEGFVFELLECRCIKRSSGIGIPDENEEQEIVDYIEKRKSKDDSLWKEYSTYKCPTASVVYVRKDCIDMFEKHRKPGRNYKAVMQRMNAEIIAKLFMESAQ